MSATAAPRKTRRILTTADHQQIQEKARINIDGGENYAPVIQKNKGVFQWSIHVFQREATLGEINAYEQIASRVEFKGQKAQIKGSQIEAATRLYNRLVARSFDVVVGLKTYDELDREASIKTVPPLVKREAIRELLGEVYSASRMEEIEGDREDGRDPDKDEDDLEDHTSDERLD